MHYRQANTLLNDKMLKNSTTMETTNEFHQLKDMFNLTNPEAIQGFTMDTK